MFHHPTYLVYLTKNENENENGRYRTQYLLFVEQSIYIINTDIIVVEVIYAYIFLLI